MGRGSIGNRRDYKTVRGYYISGGYNEGFGGKFNFLLEPLIGNDSFMSKKQITGNMRRRAKGMLSPQRTACIAI